MKKQYYVVNGGRFGGTSRATHIMYSSSPSTPDPRSVEGIITQFLWFGGSAKHTLCGLPATRHVDAFTPDEVSCRECRRRWEASLIAPEDAQELRRQVADLREAFDQVKAAAERQHAAREQMTAQVRELEAEAARELAAEHDLSAWWDQVSSMLAEAAEQPWAVLNADEQAARDDLVTSLMSVDCPACRAGAGESCNTALPLPFVVLDRLPVWLAHVYRLKAAIIMGSVDKDGLLAMFPED